MPVLMHQNWHHLLFLHWEIPAKELQALLPRGLTVDLFEGKAYVGLIPFTMTGVRPVMTPALPLLSSFHEVNVRTYVHRAGGDPGVWFFSLDASSRLAVAAARAMYKLPYFHARITMNVAGEIDYQTHRDDPRGGMPAHAHFRYRPVEGPATPAVPGTIEHFLIERYILYAADDAHRLRRARVHHAPYAIQRAEVPKIEESLIRAAGIMRSDAAPLRHYVREVRVGVSAPEMIGDP